VCPILVDLADVASSKFCVICQARFWLDTKRWLSGVVVFCFVGLF